MNKAQLLALLRAVLVSAGTTGLVTRGWLSSPHLEMLVGFIVAAAPVIWSMWAKTHAEQAKQAIEIVNTVQGIVGNASTGDVELLPGASPKPAPAAVPPGPIN